MRRLFLAFGTALLALAGPACYLTHRTDGPPLRPDLTPFQVGVTTKAEVLAHLGPPNEIRRQFDGDLFIYRTDESRSETLLLIPFFPIYSKSKGEARFDLVSLLFDRQGRLAGTGTFLGR